MRVQSAPAQRVGHSFTFGKFDEIPSAWLPKRRSDAIATQSFPTMATTEPPLYSMIDYSHISDGIGWIRTLTMLAGI